MAGDDKDSGRDEPEPAAEPRAIIESQPLPATCQLQLCIATACRRDELRALGWSDVLRCKTEGR